MSIIYLNTYNDHEFMRKCYTDFPANPQKIPEASQNQDTFMVLSKIPIALARLTARGMQKKTENGSFIHM